MVKLKEQSQESEYVYKYKDLEGKTFGPFKAALIAKWDDRKLLDDDLTVYRISPVGESETLKLKNIRKLLRADVANSELEHDTSKHQSAPHPVNQNMRPATPIIIVAAQAPANGFHGPFSFGPPISMYASVLSSLPIADKRFSDPEHAEEKPEVLPVFLQKAIKQEPNDLDESNANKISSDISSNNSSATPLGSSTNTLSGTTVSGGSANNQKNRSKPYDPERYESLPLMRLPDPGSVLVSPEHAHAKVFSLYQLIVTVPVPLKHFFPYDKETVCCELCKTNLTGSEMFLHLINAQHLNKISSCVFSEADVEYWIQRVNNVIKCAAPTSLVLPGFEPEVHLNKAETVDDFINRTKGFVRKLNAAQLKKTAHTQFLDIAFNKEAATQYTSNKANRSKRKLTGLFLSQVVEHLIDFVEGTKFRRQYGRLIDHHFKCTFCSVKFETFYDACRHIGSQQHREKTSMLLFHESLVATWVRLLSGFSTENKRQHDNDQEGTPAKRNAIL